MSLKQVKQFEKSFILDLGVLTEYLDNNVGHYEVDTLKGELRVYRGPSLRY